MNEKDRRQRLYVAQQGAKVRAGQISRREFLRRAAVAGFAVSAAGLMRMDRALAAPPTMPSRMPHPDYPDAQIKWMKEVGGKFKGTTVRLSSESTAPSQITVGLIADNFTKYTGIDVKWEQTPLDQVLAKITQDTATQNASNDIYYLDQSWIGRFSEDIVDTRAKYMNDKGNELNMPEFDFADFVPELVPAISEYNGILVGMPYDIPIFIFSYRKDVFEQLKLKVPTTMPEFLAAAKAIFEAKLTNKDNSPIYGYVGQWKSGHYSLQCDWTSWLWSHGGSHTGKGNSVVINDAQGLAGAQYMMELAKYTDPGSTTYDWSGAGDAMAAGSGAMTFLWNEFNPGYDGEKSKVVGLVEPGDLPKEDALRSPKDCSFGEIPAIGHQGGSCLAISKYSKIPDAAYVFLQWVTCKETIALAAAQSNTPVRISTFNDPRILAKAKPVPGSTRHFPVSLKTIQTRMGTEPHFPGWADVSATGAVIPTELGKMTAGGQDPKTTLDNIAAAIDKAIKES